MLGYLKRASSLLTTEGARRGYVAVVDQAIYSANNFVSGILLARLLSKEEFGTYVVCLATVSFIIGLQGSLITGPMLVLGTERRSDETEYFSSVFALQLASTAAIAILMWLMHDVLGFVVREPGLGTAFALVFVVMSMQEFNRKVFLTKRETTNVLLFDSVLFSTQVAILFIFSQYMNRMAGGSFALIAMDILIASFGVSAFVGWFKLAPMISRNIHWEGITRYAKEHWHFGKWLLGTAFGGVAFSHLTTVIVGAFAGVAASANFEAARLIVAPAQVVLFAAGNYLTPMASRHLSLGGIDAVRSYLGRLAPIWMVGFVSYLIFGIVAAGFALRLFFGGKYASSETVAILWVVVFFVLGLKQLPGTALIAIRRPDVCMWITLFIGLLTAGLTGWFTLMGGEALAVVARFIGEALLVVSFTYYAKKSLFYDVRGKNQ